MAEREGQIAFLVTREERRRFKLAATERGLTLSAWLRSIATREAGAVLAEARQAREDAKAIIDDRQAV